MFDIQAILEKLFLWQLTLIMAVSMLALGFTGQGIFGEADILKGKENLAIIGGFGMMAVTVLLRYLPPPQRRGEDNSRPHVAISPTQTALCAQIVDWTLFDEAANLRTADWELNKDELRIKNTEIRLELGTVQGLLMRKVDESGKHLVMYRYADERTVFKNG